MKRVLKVFRHILPTAFALWAVTVVSLVMGTSSCGAPDFLDATLLDKVPNAEAIPGKENYDRWKNTWDKKSWVVALKKGGGVELNKSSVKNKVVDAFLQFHNIQPSSQYFLQAQSLLAKNVRADFVSLAKAPRLAYIPNVTVGGFATVKVNHSEFVWNSLQQFGSSVAASSDAMRNFAFGAWDALSTLPEAAWVEPDLESQLWGEYKAPTELSDTLASDTFKRFRGEEAYKFVAENNLLQDGKVREVVVGVIDTGIDYVHPSLKNRMFVNPRETPNNQVDDDKNGYIDDVYGIDASLDIGEEDTGPSPTPGPADLGGPGKACPQNDPNNKCGHGTHVAGIIAAESTGAKVGPIGICPTCRLYSFRATGRETKEDEQGNEYEMELGISDAAQIRSLAYILNFTKDDGNTLNVHIVNMSIGKYFRSRAIAFLIRSLQDNHILVVAAAGNERTETPSYPGAFASVLAVCATSVPKDSCEDSGCKVKGRGAYGKASFSNFGDWVDICAPGTNIRSAIPGPSGMRVESGTSQATPFVAGAAGYLLSIKPTLFGNDVQQILKEYANADELYYKEGRAGGSNEKFKGTFKGGEHYFYLGRGALDLENSVKSLVGRGVPNYLNSVSLMQAQVKSGCVASTVVDVRTSFWLFTTSAPFLLFITWSILRFARLARKARR